MPNISDLRFSTCAYFYKLKDGVSLSDRDIHNMQVQVTATKNHNNYLYDLERVAGPNGTKYSLRVFKDLPKTPGFMSVSENGWVELKIGYFLFVECGRYVAVLKRNCTIPKDVSAKLEHIDYDKMIALYADADTMFHKMSMQNLDGSDHAMRYKSFEALNLKDNISPIGTSRYYLRSVKGANGDDRFSLTLGASRINEFDGDYTVSDICGWVHDVVDEIIGVGGITSSFLRIFAKPENYADVYQNLEPSSLLVFYGLIMYLHDEEHAQFYHVKDGVRTLIDDTTFYQYIQRISKSYSNVATIVEPNGTRYFTGINNTIEIRKRKSGIKLYNKTWNNIVIEGTVDAEYDGTLLDLINKHSLFNVYFTDTELIYNNRTLFRDTRLIDSAPHFLDVLKPKLSRGFLYEKHAGKTAAGEADWHADSMFKFVEDNFMNEYSYFICDDCGKEWADHIGIKDDRITFFVEKHKDSQYSASDFQDVVGQALKNIANLIPSDGQLDDKRDFWNDIYNTSLMHRFRSARGNVDDAIAEWKKCNLRPNCKREMCLVVDFLSYRSFKQQLDDLLAGNPVQYETELRQRLWLLSSFVNNCLEYGVTPLIYCRP